MVWSRRESKIGSQSKAEQNQKKVDRPGSWLQVKHFVRSELQFTC